jgi:hypothetical protein
MLRTGIRVEIYQARTSLLGAYQHPIHSKKMVHMMLIVAYMSALLSLRIAAPILLHTDSGQATMTARWWLYSYAAEHCCYKVSKK